MSRRDRTTCRVEFEDRGGQHVSTVRVPSSVRVTQRTIVNLLKARTGEPVYSVRGYVCTGRRRRKKGR